MALAIDESGLKLLEGFEGLRLQAYQDPVGVWTIGYGTTSAAGVVSVQQGMTCTQAQAELWLQEYVDRSVIPAIEAACAVKDVALNQNQVNALCSLGYNLGSGCFGPNWTIGADLRAGKLTAVSADFLLYDRGNGVVIQGLLNRREAEKKVFDTAPPAPVKSYHYDWFDATVLKLPTSTNSERVVVENYDKQRADPVQNKASLAKIELNLADLITRLENVMSSQDPAGLKFHRAWRLAQLKLRAAGKVVKPS